jgi:hypothetical protein
MEQIEGVFTAPVALFKRLHDAPSWVPALIVMMSLALVMSVVWAFRVDVDAFLRPMLERNPQVSADQIDMIVNMQKKFMPVFAVVGIVVVAIIIFLVGLVYWALGLAFSEGDRPTYSQGLVAATVPGLITAPWMLIIIALCILKGPVAVPPERVAPTSLGYFIASESPKVATFLFTLDAFAIASWVLAFLACRHTLRMKPVGAALAVGLVVLASIGLKVLGAK